MRIVAARMACNAHNAWALSALMCKAAISKVYRRDPEMIRTILSKFYYEYHSYESCLKQLIMLGDKSQQMPRLTIGQTIETF